jgi:hypothetical protein
MKISILAIFAIFLVGCGSEVPEIVEPPADNSEVLPTPEPSSHQPFLFEPIGDVLYESWMPVDLAQLPWGDWLVALRDGNVFILTSQFQIYYHDSIDTDLYLDNGVSGFALANDFETSGLIYFYLTAPDTETPPCQDNFCNQVLEFKIPGGRWDFLTEEKLILHLPMLNRIGQHNGGGIVMGPDDRLYVTVGDGYPQDENVTNPAQDPSSNLGKILAITPSDASVEIVGSGLRNPYTSTSIPGGFVIGDVGRDLFEEINLYTFESTHQNYGWPLEEGSGGGGGYIEPIHGYTHCSEEFINQDPFDHEDHEAVEMKLQAVKNHNGVVHPCGDTVITVIGYYPNSDDADPYGERLDGSIFYTDVYYGWVRAFNIQENQVVNDRHIGHLNGLTSMAVGADGYLYAVSIMSQSVMQLVPNPQL